MLAFSGYITHTISLPEMLWTAVTFFGLTYQISTLREALKDVQFLRNAGINSIREFAANTSLLSETLRTFVVFSFVLVGVIAMTLPAPTNGQGQPPTFGYVLTAVFILDAALISLGSMLDKYRRKRLIEMMQELEDFNHE